MSTWPTAKDKPKIRDLTAKIPTPQGTVELDFDANKPGDLILYDRLLDRLNQLPPVAPAVSVPAAPVPVASDTPNGMLVVSAHHPFEEATMLSEAVQLYLEERQREWPKETYDEYSEYFNVFLEAIGNRALATIDRKLMSSYRETLLLLPPNRKKAKATRNMSLKQVIASQVKQRDANRKAEARGEKPAPLKTLASKTVECYMSALSTFFTWCVDHGKMANNPAVRLCKAKGNGGTVKRHPFKPRELQMMFDARRMMALTETHNFWVPLMLLFTGARINEIAALTIDDIRKVPDADGKHPDLWEIIITRDFADEDDGEEHHLKNENAQRRVPLHPELVRMGFLDYLADVKASGSIRLFPALTKGRRGYGRKVQYHLTTLMQKLGIKRPGKVVHSFRHTVISMLHQRDVRPPDYQLIVGHESRSSSTPYISDYELHHLYDNAFPKFVYHDLDLSGIRYDKEQFPPSCWLRAEGNGEDDDETESAVE
jgi:integrase